MTEIEKKEIHSHISQGQKLPSELKQKLLVYIKNIDAASAKTPNDNVCCDLGIDPPDRYQWISFQDCKSFGGTAVDNSKCGH